MDRIDFTEKVQPELPNNILNRSITYTIKQQEEEDNYYDNKFRFTHFMQPKENYVLFGGEPPTAKIVPKEFLKSHKVLDIQYFRTTPYLEVCKTFEDEDSWQQDVMLFMVDVDDARKDSIILREVYFSRPVKQ